MSDQPTGKRISELAQTDKLGDKDIFPAATNDPQNEAVFRSRGVPFSALKSAVIGETADNVDVLNNLVTHVPNQIPSLVDVFAGVRSNDGYFLPFLLRNGQGCFIDPDGKLQVNAASADIPARPLIECEAFELPNGAICTQIIVDPDNRVKEAWTADGGYYVQTPNGLKNVSGNAKVAAKNITYATASGSVTGMLSTRLSVNPDPRICYIIVTGGQSLAEGWNTLPNDVLIATDPLYPDSCFMFRSPRGAGKENPNRESVPITELESLRETINGNWKESAASSLAAHIVHEVEKHTGHRIRTLSYIAATGAKPYMDLTRGTAAWDALVQGFIDARDICEREGWIPVVLGLDWMAGESDMDKVAYMTKEREKRQLMQLDRDFNAEAKRIFPDHAGDAIISVCQSAFTPNGTWSQHVRQAQYESDGIGNIRLAGPVYPFPSGDKIHINSLGQNRRGQMVARVFVWERFGTGWRTIKCTGHIWLSETKIRLPFDTPRELVLDVSGEIISPDGLGAGLGFVCDDRTSSPPTVIDAVVSSTSSIDLTLSKPFANRCGRIGYAIKRNDGNTEQDGPLVGARGCLRDSTAHESLYEPGVSHPNWCPGFILEIA